MAGTLYPQTHKVRQLCIKKIGGDFLMRTSYEGQTQHLMYRLEHCGMWVFVRAQGQPQEHTE